MIGALEGPTHGHEISLAIDPALAIAGTVDKDGTHQSDEAR